LRVCACMYRILDLNGVVLVRNVERLFTLKD